MPIQLTCPGCQAKLKAPDSVAGKKNKCPKCQTVVTVPAANGKAAAASAPATSAKSKPVQWFLQCPDGSQYGPVPRGELDDWYAEGRVSAECQLLKEGASQWQWAAEIYPALSQTLTPGVTAANTSSVSPLSGPSVSSPLTPLSSPTPFSDPLASSPSGVPSLSPLGVAPSTSAATLPSFTSGTASLAYGSAGQGSLNPYSAPASAGSYGGYSTRRGPHAMVIVAGVFHILMGLWNAVACLACSILGVGLLAAGGAIGAAGAGAENSDAQGAAAMMATFGAAGAVIAFLIGLFFLAYGVLQIVTAVGLFRLRPWARVASFVYAGLGLVAMFMYAIPIVLAFDIVSLLCLMAEIVYVIILFIAMCLPDAARDFR